MSTIHPNTNWTAEALVKELHYLNQMALDMRIASVRKEPFSLKIFAILKTRQILGYGLRDAKDFVESYPNLYDTKTYV